MPYPPNTEVSTSPPRLIATSHRPGLRCVSRSRSLVEATGTSILNYAREVLFDPLGVDTDPAAEPVYGPSARVPYFRADFAWPVDRQGIHMGWAFLKLQPDDMLALGHLYLDHGRWGGDQVVPERWIDEATTSQIQVDQTTSYGYLWWVYDLPYQGRTVRAYFASGNGGQFSFGIDELGLAVVFQGGSYNDWDAGYAALREYLPKDILPAVRAK